MIFVPFIFVCIKYHFLSNQKSPISSSIARIPGRLSSHLYRSPRPSSKFISQIWLHPKSEAAISEARVKCEYSRQLPGMLLDSLRGEVSTQPAPGGEGRWGTRPTLAVTPNSPRPQPATHQPYSKLISTSHFTPKYILHLLLLHQTARHSVYLSYFRKLKRLPPQAEGIYH